MKSSPSAPAAPDPSTTAAAQTQSNVQTAIANAQLNRVNQQTPWGSINYTQGATDPTTGVPSYSSQITLSPAQQQLLNQQQSMGIQRNQIAQQLLGQTGNSLGQPLNLSNLAPISNFGSTYGGAVNAQPQQVQPAAQQQGGMGMQNPMQGQMSPQAMQTMASQMGQGGMQGSGGGLLASLMGQGGGGTSSGTSGMGGGASGMPPDRGQISQMLAQIMAALGQGGAQGAGLGQAPSMTSGVAPAAAPAPGNQQGSPPMLAKILRSMQ